MADEQSPTQFDHRTFLKNVTQSPGIYQMLDEQGEVLYVGKAKNLRKRLASYFRSTGITPKTAALVSRIRAIEVTVTNTEMEALLLEQNLIKQNRPPYNILLRDDKSYPYIYLSTQHTYPRLSLHRGAKKREGRYFGPYPSSVAVRESLNFLQKVFRVRQCEESFFKNRSRPCLQYQINRCTAPCVEFISPEEYAEDVRQTVMFLEGRSTQLVDELGKQMEQAAAELAFEKAAAYRDRIQYLQHIQAKQYIEGESGDIDLVACAIKAGSACVQMLYVRGGRVLGSKSYYPNPHLDEDRGAVLAAFLGQYYLAGYQTHELPKAIVVNAPIEECEVLEGAIADQYGRTVKIAHSVRSNRAKWLALAETTAEQNLASRLANRQTQFQRFEQLQDALDLPEMPQRLECFDISHSHGEATVASCVVFDTGGPAKSDYRKFNINDITPGDDYAAMQQAIERRYARLKAGEAKMPDILFIDGGKGQVKQAVTALEELQINDVLVVGVAKGVDRKAGLEVLYRADNGSEVVLPADAPALHLIQHIRDEAHRFAITGHKTRRDKKRRESTLESIPGVGAKRRKALLRHFGGLQGIQGASVEDLCRVEGISEKIARDIYATFHRD